MDSTTLKKQTPVVERRGLLDSSRCRKSCQPRRRGAMMILILVMLVGFLATVAFSVDIAHMHLSRTELRSATDAASKAAAQELSRNLDQGLATAKGQEIALANLVNGEPLILDGGDFQFGRSDRDVNGRFIFSPGTTPFNTVRVIGRRTSGSASGAIPLLFGNVLGFSTFEPTVAAAATYIERDVVLVVDRSGSMSGQKFTDLQDAIDVFTSTLNGTPVDEQVGLASYSEFATEDVALTTNMALITAGMDALATGGRTSISRGMTAGESIMADGRAAEFVERTMIVMTDGMHNEGSEPSTVATTLAADGVKIHTITFGEDADQARMINVASIGHGKHFHALNAAQLEDAYREIALTLGTVITE